MSGDERVAVAESRRALRAEFPDETPALLKSFAANRAAIRAAAAQRARFLAFRSAKLSAHE